MPGTSVAVVTAAAELLQLPPTGAVASNLITTAEGTAGVNVLLTRSVFTDNETRPFGVTGQEQQETNCSSGEKAYTLAQIAPVVLAVVPEFRLAPLAPELEILITESPTARFDA